MENEVKLLLKEAEELSTLVFDTKEEAKHYTHDLSQRMQEQEAQLIEEKRKLDDMIWELRHKEGHVFNYFLSIK